MTVANKIVNDALELIGATSPIQQALPENINKCFSTLQSYLEELASKNIVITDIVIPVNLGTDLNEPADSKESIIYSLAIRTAPKLQKVASAEVRGLSKSLFQSLYNEYGPVPEEIRKNTLALGSGNKNHHSLGPAFYPEGFQNEEV